MISETYNLDCVDGMKKYKDNFFDLAIVDPPYGISIDNNKKGNFVMTKHKSKGWDNNTPNEEYWKQLFRVSKNQIIWGGNYFNLPLKKGWICWDKVNPLKGKFSDFELAWTSFLNCDRIYRQEWIGFGRKFKEKESSIHPTQKPLQLYEWIISEFSKKDDNILDTHMGSQSSRLAAHKYNRCYTGFEIDNEYFEAGNKRYEKYSSQLTIF